MLLVLLLFTVPDAPAADDKALNARAQTAYFATVRFGWLRYDRIRSLINKALASNEADRFERVRDLQGQQNLLQESFPTCESVL
jgi:hypothetical protein